jgi:hypothetical protein
MRVPDHASQIGNSTVIINGTYFPMLELVVIPGILSDMSLLKFNWTLNNFAPGMFQLQLNFENPLEVSS